MGVNESLGRSKKAGPSGGGGNGGNINAEPGDDQLVCPFAEFELRGVFEELDARRREAERQTAELQRQIAELEAAPSSSSEPLEAPKGASAQQQQQQAAVAAATSVWETFLKQYNDNIVPESESDLSESESENEPVMDASRRAWRQLEASVRKLLNATGVKAESTDDVLKAVRLYDDTASARICDLMAKTYREMEKVIHLAANDACVSKGAFARVTDGATCWWEHTNGLKVGKNGVLFLKVLMLIGFPVNETAWKAFSYGDEGAAGESERPDCHTAVALAAQLDPTLREAHSAAGGMCKVAMLVMDSTSIVAKPDFVTKNGIKQGAWEESRKIAHDMVASLAQGKDAALGGGMSVFTLTKAFGDRLKAGHLTIFGDESKVWEKQSVIVGSPEEDQDFYSGASSERFSFQRSRQGAPRVCVFRYHPSEIAPCAEHILMQLALSEAVGVEGGELARIFKEPLIRKALQRACDDAAPHTLAAVKSPTGRAAFQAKLTVLSRSETLARVAVAALAARTRTANIVYRALDRLVGGPAAFEAFLAQRGIGADAAEATIAALDASLQNVLEPVFGGEWELPADSSLRNIMQRMARGRFVVSDAVRDAVREAIASDAMEVDKSKVAATTVLYALSEVIVHMHAGTKGGNEGGKATALAGVGLWFDGLANGTLSPEVQEWGDERLRNGLQPDLHARARGKACAEAGVKLWFERLANGTLSTEEREWGDAQLCKGLQPDLPDLYARARGIESGAARNRGLKGTTTVFDPTIDSALPTNADRLGRWRNRIERLFEVAKLFQTDLAAANLEFGVTIYFVKSGSRTGNVSKLNPLVRSTDCGGGDIKRQSENGMSGGQVDQSLGCQEFQGWLEALCPPDDGAPAAPSPAPRTPAGAPVGGRRVMADLTNERKRLTGSSMPKPSKRARRGR